MLSRSRHTTSKLILLIGIFYQSTFIVSCSKNIKQEPNPIQVTALTKDTIKQRSVLYKPFYIEDAKALSNLATELGAEQMLMVLKINRRDLRHLKLGDTILLPAHAGTELEYSPFPSRISGIDSNKKLILVSRRVQAFATYENGVLVKWGPTSTGKKKTPTPDGIYHTNWKAEETHSTVDGDWVLKWNFNIDNLEGISLHEYELPGYPASHSCVRLLAGDAKWIYDWADQWTLSSNRKTVASPGTAVIVFGEYSYGKTPPWKRLLVDPSATTISPEELKEVIGKYLISNTSKLSKAQ